MGGREKGTSETFWRRKEGRGKIGSRVAKKRLVPNQGGSNFFFFLHAGCGLAQRVSSSAGAHLAELLPVFSGRRAGAAGKVSQLASGVREASLGACGWKRTKSGHPTATAATSSVL